ncbi:MAG: hypothetical protein RL100_429 [Actinomycetota bacterium]|jgi:DNA-binding LacI/PurR family transcriptional regulator
MSAKRVIQKQPTIYDVAERAGVSKSLVSLVLKGGDGVSADKKAAVLKAIEKLGYRPSKIAQRLAGVRTRTIGVLITDYKNISYIGFLRGLREVFDDAGFQVLVSDTHTNSQPVDDPTSALLSLQVDALIIAAEIPKIMNQKFSVPLATIGHRSNIHPDSDLIHNDDAHGMRLAIDHLIGLGHKKIILITGAGGISKQRRIGYEKYMTEKKLTPIIYGHGQPETEIGGYLVAKELIEKINSFTAIICSNDAMAAGVIAAFGEREISVPSDVSIVGYDNTPNTSDYFMKLTTVDDMGLPVGRETARLLLERIGGATPKKSVKVSIPCVLVERNSTTKPRKQNIKLA